MPRITPASRAAWRKWLAKHHATATEVTLVFYRKGTKPTIAYADAVEEALCFGWIDGVKHKVDDIRYSHRFSPRRPGSNWSALNKARAAKLIAAGKMTLAGGSVIEAAKASGAWANPARAVTPSRMPAELARALATSPKAKRAYAALARGYQRQYQRWVHDAKQAETRVRRARQAVAKLLEARKVP
jgi:uncharacterized protein YdeI (YjbR/CyaY-like superfamily)